MMSSTEFMGGLESLDKVLTQMCSKIVKIKRRGRLRYNMTPVILLCMKLPKMI